MPKISIIVPVYNTSEYLQECLDSLVSQSFKDLEIIAIDDASTDNSLDILKTYASKYPQLKIYHNKENQGQGITRNEGIEIAKGDYIGFLDSDDYIEPEMYKIISDEIIKNNNPDIVTTGIAFTSKESPKKTTLNYKQRWNGRLIQMVQNPEQLYWQSPSCCNKVFKRELIADYKFLPNCLWEDIAFTSVILMKAQSIVDITDKLYYYRRDITKGVSSKGYNPNSPLNDIFKVADEIQYQAKLNGVEDIYGEVIPLLQTAICLRRLSEINTWDSSEEEKMERMQSHYLKTISKYGEILPQNEALLSAKADMILTERVAESIESEKKHL